METKFNDKTPITSPQMLNILCESMERLHPAYPLILRLVIETDVPLKRLLDMHVSDLVGKSEITYQANKHMEIVRTEPISDELQSAINEYFADRNPDDLAFTGTRSGKKMHPEAFRLSLKNTSAICGFNPPATIMTLHKTYLYNTYKIDKQRALSHASSTSLKQFLDYIHVNADVPEDQSFTDVKERFYSSGILDKVTRLFNDTMHDISDDTQRPDNKPPEYFRDALNLLYSIDSSIRDFKDKTTT